MPFFPASLLPELLALADRAGAVLLEHYAGHTAVTTKADSSPVTAADDAAERVILAGLRDLSPEIPVIAEEAVARGDLPDLRGHGGRFWLVDPLDGTKEFISKNGEFTVNIGLVEDGQPVLGVVTAPVRGLAWWGAAGEGARRREGDEGSAGSEIRARARPSSGAIAVASRSHRDAETDRYLAEQGIRETVSAGSSLKFCLVAEGQADVYPRFGPTMEWDTAAGHAVLRAAGGRVQAVTGEPLAYGKPAFRNPGFIASGA
jgi:3'(2'), 5'-bisphosphate nucleotidase